MRDGTRVVVVTGASGGLGSTIAQRFAVGGDHVYLGYARGEDRAKGVLQQIEQAGGNATLTHLDLNSEASVNAAFDDILAKHPVVDVLINNAAYRPIGNFLDIPDQDWQDVLGVNVIGAVRCIRRVIPGMRDQRFGRILNMSGADAYSGWGGRSHVAVSKAALIGLTRAVAVEVAREGITVNTLVPGSFATPRDPAIFPEWESMLTSILAHTPVGKQGDPAELAEWCWWLASEHTSFTTGQEIHVNGGSFPLKRNPKLG